MVRPYKEGQDGDWSMIILLFVAGMLITGSANAINQAVEKDTDALMKRTSKRPVANGSMSQNEAYAFAIIAGIVGVAMMWYYFNLSSALVSAFSLFLYAFIYTPLKKINKIKPENNTGKDKTPNTAVKNNAQMVNGIRVMLIPFVRIFNTVAI